MFVRCLLQNDLRKLNSWRLNSYVSIARVDSDENAHSYSNLVLKVQTHVRPGTPHGIRLFGDF